MVSCLFSQSIPQVLAQDQCEGNFDCDNDCDGTDAYTFKVDFGRSAFVNPCTSMNPCDGDFDCDGDVDGSNAYAFKLDFGRSAMNNPCPSICVDYDFWCKANIADEYAQEIWGTSVARGVPLGISGEDGNLLSYAFPYALNADRFPTIEEILDAVRRVSAVYPKSDENFYTPWSVRSGNLDLLRSQRLKMIFLFLCFATPSIRCTSTSKMLTSGQEVALTVISLNYKGFSFSAPMKNTLNLLQERGAYCFIYIPCYPRMKCNQFHGQMNHSQ